MTHNLTAIPAKYFAVKPYRAEQIGPTWWAVMNKHGINCLNFLEKPGAFVTTELDSKKIAEEWNARTEPFPQRIETYVAPVTTQMTDAEMAAYVRNRRYDFVTKTWTNS